MKENPFVANLESVNFYYPPKKSQCIHNFSLDIPEKKITALVGESGSGKTTILRLLTGFLHPCDGIIRINNEIVASKRKCIPPEARNVSVVFQDYALFPHLTIKENIIFGMKKSHVINVDAAFKQLIDVFALDLSITNRYPHELSGGQMQRVALARSIAAQPALLILDEPFSNLDIALRDDLMHKVKEIVELYGMSVVYITHEKNETFAMADNIAIIKNGKLLQSGDVQTLYRQPKNVYVARYFEKANILSMHYIASRKTIYTIIGNFPEKTFSFSKLLQNEHLCIRPHELAFTNTNSLLRVVKRQYFGSYYDITCVSINAQYANEQVIVRCDVGNAPDVGMVLGVRIKTGYKPHVIRGDSHK